MSLFERSEGLGRDIESLKIAKVLASQVEAIRGRAANFEQAAAKLRAATQRAEALRSRGVGVTIDVSAASGVRHYIETWRADVAKDPSAALGAGGQTVKQKMIDPVVKIADGLLTAAEAAWRVHARVKLPRINGDTLNLLEGLPGQKAAVQSFRELHRRVLDLADVLPATAGEYDRFDTLAEQCARAWGDLDASDLPDAVRRFLREAGSAAGATLKALTPEVLTWLDQHGLVETFRIKAR
jgi:hypothetical protein